MEDVKGLLASKTVWGVVLAFASILAANFGYSLGADDQITLVDLLASLGGMVGTILAVYGRVVATKKIG